MIGPDPPLDPIHYIHAYAVRNQIYLNEYDDTKPSPDKK